MFSSNLPLFFFNCSPFVTCASFQVVFICYRGLSQTYIVQCICFAIVSFAFLKLAFFNSIFFAIVMFAFLKLAFFICICFCICYFCLSLSCIYQPLFFFALFLFFFQVENILEQAQFDSRNKYPCQPWASASVSLSTHDSIV